MPTFSSYAEPPSSADYSPPVPIILTVIFLGLFLIGFLTLYFFRYVLESVVRMWNNRRNASGAIAAAAGANMSTGLDPELIQAFPTFYYSTVKEFRCEKYGLECAICLGEFSDDDMLRLLTICCHIFHKECVDLWLESHKTCPFCRGDLDVPRISLEKSPILVHSNSVHEIGANQSSLVDAVCIDIKEDNNEKVGGEDEGQASSNRREEEDQRKRERIERFSRSHSTGHSISRSREEQEDRYTLRLLDNVKIKIVRGHNSAGSCIAFEDFTSPSDSRNGGSGEPSETRQEDKA